MCLCTASLLFMIDDGAINQQNTSDSSAKHLRSLNKNLNNATSID